MQPLRFVLSWVTVCSAVGNAPVCQLLNCTGNNKHKVEVFHSLFHLNLSRRKGIIDFVFHEKLAPNLLWGLWLFRHWSTSLGMLLQGEMSPPADITLGKHKQPQYISKIGSGTGPSVAGRLRASSPCALGTHRTTAGCACDKSTWRMMSPYSAASFSSSALVKRLQPCRKEHLERGGAAWQWKVVFFSGDLYWCPPAMAHGCYPRVTWTQACSAPSWNEARILQMWGKGTWWERQSRQCLSSGWCCCVVQTPEQSSEWTFQVLFAPGRVKDVLSPFLSQISHKSHMLWSTCSLSSIPETG